MDYNKSKVIKKLIIVFVIILLIVIWIILFMLNKSNEKNAEEITDTETETLSDIENDDAEKMNKIIETMYVFNSKNCMQLYLDAININNSKYYGYDENGNYVDTTDIYTKKEYIYNTLSSDYIKENNITIDNVFDYVETINNKMMYNLLDIKENKTDPDINCKSYITYGIMQDSTDPSIIKEIYSIVTLDLDNNTFAIKPLKDDDINEIKQQTVTEKIKKNENNSFNYVSITPEDIAIDYLNTYKYLVIGYPEYVYENLLNKEYKEKKFKTFDSFKNYINLNIDSIKKMRLIGYSKNDFDNYTEYICLNQFGNYFIFNETNATKYDILLDTYTIYNKTFLDKYNNSNEQQKVAYNAQIFIEAINNSDYKYVYDHLDQEFKVNNYPTIEDFENYIKTNLYNNMKLEFKNYINEGKTNIYNVAVLDLENTENKPIELQIIMQLKNEYDYVMSFNIK